MQAYDSMYTLRTTMMIARHAPARINISIPDKVSFFACVNYYTLYQTKITYPRKMCVFGKHAWKIY